MLMFPAKGKTQPGIRQAVQQRIGSNLMNNHNTILNRPSNSKNSINLSGSQDVAKLLSSPRLPPLSGTQEKCASDLPAENLYQSGLSLLRSDSAKALELFRLAAEKQHVTAMYSYAHLLSSDSNTAATALRIMRNAAQLGQKDAIYEYGFMLENGIGGNPNREEARHYYQIGIKNGDGRAMYRYAKMLKEAHTNPEEMYSLFKEAADLQIPNAYYEFGLCLRDGLGVSKNVHEATRVFKQLADSNDPNGMLEYALCLKNGIGIQQDLQGFTQMVHKAVATHSPDALLTYAKMLENGDGFPQNSEAAEKIYRDLAEGDPPNPFAQNCLGIYYHNRKEYNEALKYYQLAAQQHHPTALFSLAMLQLFLRKTQEGMSNLKAAADAGNERAQFNYAIYLEKDKNSDKNEILHYYKLAADAGLPNAMCNYASLIFKNDQKQAVNMFKVAADRGHVISQYRYARFMLRNEEISEAIYYFELASAANHPKSQYELALIKLGNKDVDTAMKLLKASSDAGYRKAKAKYQAIIEDTGNVSKDDPDSVFDHVSHIPDGKEALEFFDKYYDPNNKLSELRRAQVLLKSDPKTGLATISEMAKSGYVEAKFVYATILEAGEVCKPNMLEARKYYQEASKAQHARAMLNYGRILKVEDQATACRLFKEAADQNLPIAQYQYARILEISGAEEEALKYYKMASDAGIEKAHFRYGRMHEICAKIKQSYEVAAEYYKMAANKGYPKAQNNYAHVLEAGLGIEKNLELAAKYYKLAFDQGNIYASHNYARILENGIGVPKDETKAAQIYKSLAANEDNGLAQFNYARMCHNGIGVQEDWDEAKKYYLMAIENNIAEAKQNYGVLLFTKYHKWNEAARFFEMAVSGNGGQASAKYNYAQLLLQGTGVPEDRGLAERLFYEASDSFLPAMFFYAQVLEGKDDLDQASYDKVLERAARYYKKAAEWPDPEHRFLKPQRDAQYRLGLMYRDGRGVEKNDDLFNKYIKMAADNKHPDAESILNPPNFDSWKLQL
ncbi:hypothetical protein TRFO_01446 [Tritrichomonas foetus]|uniref:Sel1 repeat family protein n=1 Tax=Tritrichomonas foetus TaxID=1144522 RepID=A0A1J4JXA5_9EUKA|nr:hypothetical protein TRFO_01446 [Tritrichomonas foetus]|eukprot:OHT03783.1 hypothetical protein TRFO_01446 [Tritrichomonas foetus]